MVISYKKVDAVTYEVVSDGGSHKIEHTPVSLTVVLSNARRISQRGFSSLEPDKGEEFKRFITGVWRTDEYHFELLSEEGEKNVSLPVNVWIGIGENTYSRFQHWEPRHGGGDDFSFSFYLSQEQFDWLWNEMQMRPDAEVSVKCQTVLWLAGIESHMYYEVSYNPVRVESGERVPITTPMFFVSDSDKSASHNDANIDPEVEVERGFFVATDTEWLRRIFVLLGFIGAFLIWKFRP